MSAAEDSDEDWFNQDEDQIVESLRNHVKNQRLDSENTEYIKSPISAAEHFLQQSNLDASASAENAQSSGLRFSAADLQKLLKMEPLDKFLYMMTETHRDIFAEQFTPKDNQQRVLYYTQVLITVCKLELPGFESHLLRSFAAQTQLFQHYKRIAAKLFASKRGEWDSEEQSMLRQIKFLLLRAQRVQLLGDKGMEVLSLLKTLLKHCKSTVITAQPLCMELANDLEQIANESLTDVNTSYSREIYPTIKELVSSSSETVESISHEARYGSTTEYLQTQSHLLREDFIISLRKFIQKLRDKNDLSDFVSRGEVFVNTKIVLNPEFEETKRQSLVFVDLFAARREEFNAKRVKLSSQVTGFCNNMKWGSMLCLTSSTDFENLILATTTFTDEARLSAGYIAIKIERQYNVGNVYNNNFVMFKAPTFFEPFNKVFTCLQNCSAETLPMQEYIVHGEINTKRPKYCASKSYFTNYGKSFDICKPPKDLPLNDAQRTAYSAALMTDMCLIQGPPGTGKTHIATELVRTLIENNKGTKNLPIVVLAYTNDALDKFLLKILVHTSSICRFGSQVRLQEIVKFSAKQQTSFSASVPRIKTLYWLTSVDHEKNFKLAQTLQKEFDGTDEAYQKIVAAQNQLHNSLEKLNTLSTIMQYYGAREKDVIGMTTTYAAKKNFLFHLLKSKIVIFEEAAEILESHVVACLSPHVEHIIMIGDHMQLQPHINSYEYSRLNELNISLFERLIKQNFPLQVLDTQYRMRRQFAALLCPHIYSRLESGTNVDEYMPISGMTKNLYFLMHEQPETQKYANVYEAEALAQLATHLLQLGQYKTDDIVVLTPYQAQVEKIKISFNYAKVSSKLRITTVDSFQGLEANIVLLSLVRSNRNDLIGFVQQANRICVALSRARMGLYIVGNINVFARVSPIWRNLEEQLKQEDCIGEAFPYN